MSDKKYNQGGFRHSVLSLSCFMLLPVMAVALLILLAGDHSQRTQAQDLEKLNRFVQTSGSTDAAMKIFTEGRDSIGEEAWAKAEKRFGDFLASNPKHKNVDAAHYWLAFALNKQKKYQQAYDHLELLIRDYPESTWVDDAKALIIEVGAKLNKVVQVDQSNEELKLIALQSMFQNNPERAAQLVGEMLKPGSTQSRRIKETAISLLGQHRRPETTAMLIELARNQQDPKLRKTAVFWLGQTNDESALDVLKEISAQSSAEIANRPCLPSRSTEALAPPTC
jgi:thioredoxin-like negative regulator of GroEL